MTDEQNIDVGSGIARNKYPVEDMRRIFIRWLPPGKSIEMVAAVRIDGRRTLLLGRRGSIYCSDKELGYYQPPTRVRGLASWPWGREIMKGLCSLGVISQEQFVEHMTQYEFWRQERAKGFDRDELHKIAERYGFKLTTDQVRAVARREG